jgi:DNA-binding NarL/FixJ family response regulator
MLLTDMAAGHSNPEVAAKLYISRRTVEDHLSKSYRKFGVRSRTELANWLHSHDQAAMPLDPLDPNPDP